MRGAATLGFDFSGFGLRLEGLPPSWRRRLLALWRGFASEGPLPPRTLGVRVILRRGPLPESPFDPKAIIATGHPLGTRFTLPEGFAEPIGPDEVQVEVTEGGDPRHFYGFLNLCRAVFAAWLPARGGALLHAAGVVVEARAFLLVGGEGSGKTTFAQRAAAGGALVLGDDLVLVDTPGPNPPHALAAPLRPQSLGPPAPGRWPIACLLFPSRGAPAALEPIAELEVQARLVANLPFLERRLGRDETLARLLQRLASLPARRLRFAPDASFVDLLAAFE